LDRRELRIRVEKHDWRPRRGVSNTDAQRGVKRLGARSFTLLSTRAPQVFDDSLDDAELKLDESARIRDLRLRASEPGCDAAESPRSELSAEAPTF